MARLFPPTLEGESPTGGEERVFGFLKRVLPDEDHWAWYAPRLRTGRTAREPDFVLLGPDYGLLVLEVKDWSRPSLTGGTRNTLEVAGRDGAPVSHTHPEKQAAAAGYVLREILERTPSLCHPSGKHKGRPFLPVNWGVVWPNLTRADLERLARGGIPLEATKALTREDLERTDEEGTRRLLAALARLVDVRFPFDLDERTRDRVWAVVEPQIRMLDLRAAGAETTADPVAVGSTPETEGSVSFSPLPELPGFPLDAKQRRIARGLASPRTLVYGPAGSGKTIFLVSRAQYWLDAKPDTRILFTCYNASLASHLRHLFALHGIPPDGKRLTVRHYHDLCGSLLGMEDIHERSPEFYAALEPRVLQELTAREDPPAYDLILVDEGQDFTRRMVEVLVRLSAGGGEITLVCDPAQDIYGRWSPDNLSPLRGHETERLVDCYRNTAMIFGLALAVLSPDVRRAMGLERLEMTRPEDLGNIGDPPELVELPGLDELVSLVEETAAAFDRENRPLSEMAVLYPDRGAIPNFWGRLRHAHWGVAKNPRFATVGDEKEEDGERPEPEVTTGTLHPESDRDDVPPSELPHFAEALERELNERGVPAEWVARSFASKAAYDISKARLTLSTIHSAKGMDFHTVILLGADTLTVKPGTAGRRAEALLFTGITRARVRLVLPFFLDRNWVPELRERIETVREEVTS